MIYVLVSLSVIGLMIARLDTADPMNLIFVHVPSAWLSLLIYLGLTGVSITYLVTKSPYWVKYAVRLCEIGGMITFLTLMTGSIWAHLTWGSYWVWDVRLTSELILALFYFTCYRLFLIHGGAGSWMCVITSLLIPLLVWSVEWWSGLHQGTSSSFHPIYECGMMVWMILLFSFVLYWLWVIKR
jgi:heme exporter protein C